MTLHDQRLQVLQKLERGELSMEDAARLLSRLDAGESINIPSSISEFVQPEAVEAIETIEPVEEPFERSAPEKKHQRSELWLLPFVIGLLLTLFSVTWMLQGYQIAGLGWGFWLSFFPLALGVLIMWFGWEIRQARWLHLRIQQGKGSIPKLIAFSLPIPTGMLRWGLRRFGHFQSFQQMQSTAEFIEGLDAAVAKDGPVHILVDDDKDGEKVEIWID